ncbi:hypothetical protein [uncultured Gemmiger sp.]|uniref:hypothetical protein n=1 Tax=uncultured Gemmiger sp. TaxID=1623490 RepID=UPI0026064727|nr:hypothetical protein [uncultured Gemmiger sp.]
MTQSKRKKVGRLLLLLLVSIIAAYVTNWQAVQSDGLWDFHSEELVWGRAANAIENGFWADGALLGAAWDANQQVLNVQDVADGTQSIISYVWYGRQSGLQGSIVAAIVMLACKVGIPFATTQRLLWVITAGLMVFMLVLLAGWFKREWGNAAAAGVLSCLVFCAWMQKSMANMYWLTWMMLAPMIVTAYWGHSIKTQKSWPKGSGELLLFAVIFAKFLCGYEFITTIMLASELPILYYFLTDKTVEKKKWVWTAFKIGVLELVAFALSFGVLGVQNMACQGVGYWQALQNVIEAAKFRTGSFTETKDLSAYLTDESVIRIVQDANKLDVLKSYLTSDEMIWGALGFKQLLLLTIVAIAGGKVLCKKSWKSAGTEIVILLLSTVPAISWFYIGYGHAVIHCHIDYILWNIPFLPVCMALLFKNLNEIYNACKIRRKETEAQV